MDTSHSDTSESISPARNLGAAIRTARKKRGWSMAKLADKVSRPREWLNRVELGYSEWGEHKPPSNADLKFLLTELSGSLEISPDELFDLRNKADQDFEACNQRSRRKNQNGGKITQAEIILGEAQIADAIVDLINEQHSDAIIRNTGVKGLGSYLKITSDWKKYREALGNFLRNNPNGLFKRVEYAATNEHLDMAKAADARLAGDGRVEQVHNAKIKFHKHNPLQMHVLIGQREAILAIPQSSRQAGSNMAILVRDKLFVEALRVWYDEVLWEGAGPSRIVDFSNFDESFDEVKEMYGFKDHN